MYCFLIGVDVFGRSILLVPTLCGASYLFLLVLFVFVRACLKILQTLLSSCCCVSKFCRLCCLPAVCMIKRFLSCFLVALILLLRCFSLSPPVTFAYFCLLCGSSEKKKKQKSELLDGFISIFSAKKIIQNFRACRTYII